MRRSPALLAALALALLGLTGCGGDDTASDASTVTCSYPTSGAAAKSVDAPDTAAPKQGAVSLSIKTSVGTLTGTLDSDRTPCTVHSFVSLAEQGYFDGTTCHRLTTSGIFVVQCGDPTGTGRGGPGYSFADELSGDETYPAGTIAMANAGADTNGSQFFLVYRDSTLSPDYTVFGTLDDAAVKVLQQVASQGTTTQQPDGPPKVPVDLEQVTTGSASASS